MGWNNNYGNRRDGGWGGSYGPRGGYRDDRYENRNGRGYYEQQPMQNFLYSRGQKCALRANPSIVVNIVRIGREQYECRLPDLRCEWFYEDELMPVDETQK